MVTQDEFRRAARLAIRNVINHGDTDIFPFPFENHIFFDKPQEVEDLIVEYNDNFDEYLTRFSPRNVSSLTPVSYSGFRWATQLDPAWNVYLLTCVLALGPAIERVRIEKTQGVVFSYRFLPDATTGHLFDPKHGWYQFMESSLARAKEFEFVVACDISEFYPRLNHHRLEIALKQIAGDTPYPKRIDRFLSNYSNTRSFGLPIGGPAARILSEITINQIDRLLLNYGVTFTRFADDYPIYSNVLILLDKLYDDLTIETRLAISSEIRSLIRAQSHIMRVDVHLSFALRVIAHDNTPENLTLLQQLYAQRIAVANCITNASVCLLRSALLAPASRWYVIGCLACLKSNGKSSTLPYAVFITAMSLFGPIALRAYPRSVRTLGFDKPSPFVEEAT